MKPHAVLSLRPSVPHRELGSWIAALSGGATVGPPFEPGIDAVLARHRFVGKITAEHQPAGSLWSADERSAGLDRRFRVVAGTSVELTPALLDDLAAAPVVEGVTRGAIGVARLPVSRPGRAASGPRPSAWARSAVALDDVPAGVDGRGVTVAVLDTGIDLAHPEYSGRLQPGFDTVDLVDGADEFVGDRLDADPDPSDRWVGHGSHVTGIVAARGVGMGRGVAPRCRILPVRVLGALRRGDRPVGAGLVDNISAGIKWAVDHGADVITMSLGVRHDGGGLPHRDVIRYALARGVVVTAAAGNDGTNTLYYPSALPGVIAVGAVDSDGAVAPYSTWGDQVAVVAPGTEIWSSWLDGSYAFATGTSQATPFVAGAAALCQGVARSAGARLRPAQVAHVLEMTADRAGTAFRDRRDGFGRVNVRDALALTEYLLERRTERRGVSVPA